jgi:hypothetical protein
VACAKKLFASLRPIPGNYGEVRTQPVFGLRVIRLPTDSFSSSDPETRTHGERGFQDFQLKFLKLHGDRKRRCRTFVVIETRRNAHGGV